MKLLFINERRPTDTTMCLFKLIIQTRSDLFRPGANPSKRCRAECRTDSECRIGTCAKRAQFGENLRLL